MEQAGKAGGPGPLTAHGSMEKILELEIPARPEYIAIARLVVSSIASFRRNLPDDRIDDLKLAVSEACTNAIEAYGGAATHPGGHGADGSGAGGTGPGGGGGGGPGAGAPGAGGPGAGGPGAGGAGGGGPGAGGPGAGGPGAGGAGGGGPGAGEAGGGGPGGGGPGAGGPGAGGPGAGGPGAGGPGAGEAGPNGDGHHSPVEVDVRVCRVRIQARDDDEKLEIEIADTGPGFDPNALPSHPPVTDPERLNFERGLGIPLIRTLVDDVVFASSSAGTSVRMTLFGEPLDLHPPEELGLPDA